MIDACMSVHACVSLGRYLVALRFSDVVESAAR